MRLAITMSFAIRMNGLAFSTDCNKNLVIGSMTCLRAVSCFRLLARRMIDLMPRLANLRVRRVWRGLYPMTPDGLPIVGKVKELKGYINAVGMCGQGFMIGPGLALYLVKMVQDKLSAEDRAVLSVLSVYRDFGGEEKLK